jgi:hypothetical protein
MAFIRASSSGPMLAIPSSMAVICGVCGVEWHVVEFCVLV